MDREFPSVLFPSIYTNDPPDTAPSHCAGSWGSYGRLRPATPGASSSSHRFKAQYGASAEVWCHTEPVPVPLFSPKHAAPWPPQPVSPQHFDEQLQNLFVDHPLDVFSSTAGLFGDTVFFGKLKKKFQRAQLLQDGVSGKKMILLDKQKNQATPRALSSARMDAYSSLLSDAVHSVPVELLASLLHEELSQQSLEATFCEAHTGGALDLIPFPSSTQGAPQSGCLVYCANGVDKLSFQQVALQPGAVVCSDEASSFLLKGPVQQISSSSTCGHNSVAVRSLYHCGVWGVCSSQKPHLLQAMSSRERLNCVSVSPHVVGELLVAAENGAAHLWRLEHGLQLVRTEDSNLYFNGQSSWRWCEFSAHPRVMLYADRTGVELTDARVQPTSSHTLFRISKAAECRSGERLLLCRYLSQLHSFHHLVTTQYSAYIVDERFPCVPMLKWDHLMESPPIFCHALPAPGPGAGAAKVLLGSERSQEVTLLQYSGGGAEACVSHGPLQALLRPRDSVEHLPPQIPHRTEGFWGHLTHPATGLTAVHLKTDERFCVLQLLQTGDIFYQILEKACSPTEPRPKRLEPQLSPDSTSVWKQWLQKLSKHHKGDRRGDVTVNTALHVSKRHPSDTWRTQTGLERTQTGLERTQTGLERTQRGLKRSMEERRLPTGFTEPIKPVRGGVLPEEWSDELSSRLTAAWDGEEAWKRWWAERLGSNAAAKTQALRRKRRREKDARRASGLTLLAMSTSFSSFIGNQSEHSDPSDWAGSDTGGAESQPKDPPIHDTQEKQKLSPPSAGTEEREKTRPQVETPTRTRPQVGTPTRTRPLFSEATLDPPCSPPPSVHPIHLTPKPAASSRTAFSWSQSSQRPSQSSQRPSQSSQWPSQSSQKPSQSSQRPSQSSQPRKKSRMGF